MFGNQPESNYDWNFTLMDIPVRVTPFFWLLGLIIGFSGGGSNLIISIISWSVAIFVSFVAHEMGHAMVGRMFGSRNVYIVLHGLSGGAYNATGRTKWQRIQVIAAGPGMDFIIALPFVTALVKTPVGYAWLLSLIPGLEGPLTQFVVKTGGFIELQPAAYTFLFAMVWATLYLGLFNLIPVFPLDGGQILSELVSGDRMSLGVPPVINKVSIVVAVIVGVLFLKEQRIFGLVIFGYLAYINYKMLTRRPY